jgi:ABC-type lipoprotein release transport system permease subunit
VSALAITVVALALPLGIVAGRLVYHAYIDRIGARNDLSVPYALLATLAVGLLVIGNVATVVPARRAGRDLPARVLTDE